MKWWDITKNTIFIKEATVDIPSLSKNLPM